jgi:hypothetical protein
LSKNTLYISFDGLSDPLGQSQILPYIISIAQNDYAVTVLSCEKPAALLNEKKKIEARFSGLPIDWKFVTYEEKGGAFSRYRYLRQLSAMAFEIAGQKKIALSHCRSYLSALIGLKLKKKKQIPFLFDMRGFWADERIEGGIWKKSNPIHFLFYSYFKSREQQFLERSDRVVSLTWAGLKYLAQQFPHIPINDKTKIIPCCTDLSRFDRSKVKKANLPKGVSENDFLMIYTGSIGTWYFTKEMIDCVLTWRKFIPNIKLLVLTKDQEELQKILGSYNADQRSIISSESVSYAEVPSYLALAKAAIYFIKPVFSKTASSPTKMAECWAMDLPIITNAGIGDNDLYFNEKRGGILLKEFTRQEYERVGLALLEQLKQNNNYREIALQFFDNKKGASQYLDIYNALS